MRWMTCGRLLVCLLGLCVAGLSSANAGEPIAYQDLLKAPEKHKGKTLKFAFAYRGLAKSLGKMALAGGFTDEKHVQLQTPNAGTLPLLVPRSKTFLIRTLGKAGKDAALHLYGTVKPLPGEAGGFVVVVIAVMPVKKKASSSARKTSGPTKAGTTQQSGGLPTSYGKSRGSYKRIKLHPVERESKKYEGKRLEITVPDAIGVELVLNDWQRAHTKEKAFKVRRRNGSNVHIVVQGPVVARLRALRGPHRVTFRGVLRIYPGWEGKRRPAILIVEQTLRITAQKAGWDEQIEYLIADLKRPSERGRAITRLAKHGPKAWTAVPALLLICKDKRWGTRRITYAALGKIRTPAAKIVPVLLRAFKIEDAALRRAPHNSHWLVLTRETLINTLGKIGPRASGAISVLIGELGHSHPRIRREAAESLGLIGPAASRALGKLERLLSDKDMFVAGNAITAIGRIGKPSAKVVKAIRSALKDDRSHVRHRAAWALGDMRQPERVRPLIEQLLRSKKDHWNAKNIAAHMIRRHRFPIKVAERLVPALLLKGFDKAAVSGGRNQIARTLYWIQQGTLNAKLRDQIKQARRR